MYDAGSGGSVPLVPYLDMEGPSNHCILNSGAEDGTVVAVAPAAVGAEDGLGLVAAVPLPRLEKCPHGPKPGNGSVHPDSTLLPPATPA